jgi:Tfp pilus assembly protein PilF
VRLLVLIALVGGAAYPAERHYELKGRLVPQSKAAVSLFGATTPFRAAGSADSQGRFRFRDLARGQYTVAVFIPGSGETRQTVDVGPGTADSRGRVSLVMPAEGSRLLSAEALHGPATVSTRELSIPETARRAYREAQKSLSRRDVAGAVAHLEQAVRIAPQFSAAWNNLGTIAYQSREYANAERHFRKALEHDPGSFEPLVNLGGVLLTEGKLEEGLQYNSYAVLTRPTDALANSQLGMNYFSLGNLVLGQKYLETARRIDPGHFSYPQLTLAQIHLRRHDSVAAAAEFRDFLERHPDAGEAARVRDLLRNLEK